jgi:hypothetical protein
MITEFSVRVQLKRCVRRKGIDIKINLKTEGKKLLAKHRRKWDDIIKMYERNKI